MRLEVQNPTYRLAVVRFANILDQVRTQTRPNVQVRVHGSWQDRTSIGVQVQHLGRTRTRGPNPNLRGFYVPHLAFLLPFPPLFETTSIAFDYQHCRHHNVKSVNSAIHFRCLLTRSSPFFQYCFPDLAPTLAGLFFRYYCLAIGSVRI